MRRHIPSTPTEPMRSSYTVILMACLVQITVALPAAPRVEPAGHAPLSAPRRIYRGYHAEAVAPRMSCWSLPQTHEPLGSGPGHDGRPASANASRN